MIQVVQRVEYKNVDVNNKEYTRKNNRGYIRETECNPNKSNKTEENADSIYSNLLVQKSREPHRPEKQDVLKSSDKEKKERDDDKSKS
jgi:ABC-type metal ion transport system substrate-binding protein